ncbi:MAG: type II toxin-antitoxin system toxin DNA ADP-ribosyl transferase DarT [Acidiferrobacter sp.]
MGDYVPFYFCPRSIMPYIIHCANHPELHYRGGQGPIVHLEADLRATVAWGEAQGQRWAFSLSNAGASYTELRNQWAQLAEIRWAAVAATDFRDSAVKEGKQAEFLMREFFPWSLVRRIGVRSAALQRQVLDILSEGSHQVPVEMRHF